MKEIQIKDENEKLLVKFDGNIWEIFSECYSDEPTTFYHNQVKESPFYLFHQFEEFENQGDIIKQLRERSSEFKEMAEDFQQELSRLEKRLILFECYGEGMIDVFTDLLTVSKFQNDDALIVETSIQTDFSDSDNERNALGEICVERVNAVSTSNGKQLFEAINEVASDKFDRWENIDWSWDVIISNLESQYPKLADELKQITQEHLENI